MTNYSTEDKLSGKDLKQALSGREQEAELQAWRDAAYEWNCTTPEELKNKIQKDQMRQLVMKLAQ